MNNEQSIRVALSFTTHHIIRENVLSLTYDRIHQSTRMWEDGPV